MGGTRRYKRVRLAMRVDCLVENTVFSDFSSDLSEGGMCLSSLLPIPEGANVELKFSLPEASGESFKLQGRVVWCRSDEGDNPLGIEFHPEAEAQLKKFSEKFRGAYGDEVN